MNHEGQMKIEFSSWIRELHEVLSGLGRELTEPSTGRLGFEDLVVVCGRGARSGMARHLAIGLSVVRIILSCDQCLAVRRWRQGEEMWFDQ
jgi:hypothetical protein